MLVYKSSLNAFFSTSKNVFFYGCFLLFLLTKVPNIIITMVMYILAVLML